MFKFVIDNNGNLTIYFLPVNLIDKREWLGLADEAWSTFEHFLQGQMPDEMSFVTPESVGGLTDSPIIQWNDDIFWFPNYQIENPYMTLIGSGNVTFTKAEEYT